MLFDDANCKIDSVVFNRSRISRLPGTWNRKGSKSSKDRPQRICRFLNVPDEIKVNEKEFFQKVANLLPKEETPSKENNFRPINYKEFNLQEFFDKYHIEVLKETRIDRGTRYILKDPPPRTGQDGVPDDWSVSFFCFHNGCTSNGWREFRAHFDKDAYSRQARGEWKQKDRRERPQVDGPRPIEELPAPDGKEWLMEDIQYLDLKNLSAIPTGHEGFDRKADSSSERYPSCRTERKRKVLLAQLHHSECRTTRIQGGDVQWRADEGEGQDLAESGCGRKGVREEGQYDDLHAVTARVRGRRTGSSYDNKYGRNWSRLLQSVREWWRRRE